MSQDREADDRPHVVIHAEQCKGCGRCVVACPAGNLALSRVLNRSGYRTVEAMSAGCRGCGICFYSCPEPGAITVYRGKGAGKAAKGSES